MGFNLGFKGLNPVKNTQKAWLNKFAPFGGSSKVYRIQSSEGSNLTETGLFEHV